MGQTDDGQDEEEENPQGFAAFVAGLEEQARRMVEEGHDHEKCGLTPVMDGDFMMLVDCQGKVTATYKKVKNRSEL